MGFRRAQIEYHWSCNLSSLAVDVINEVREGGDKSNDGVKWKLMCT